MKAFFGIAFVAVLLLIGFPSIKRTAAVTTSSTPASVAVVTVTIDCPGHAKSGAVASITLVPRPGRQCPEACYKGSGGTATFNRSGYATTTIYPTCTATDLGGCEVAAVWQDPAGNVIEKREPIDRTTTPPNAKIKC